MHPNLKICHVQGLENSVSRVSRLIWALHLTFNEGISDHFAQILSQQYPSSLLPELQQSCQVCSVAAQSPRKLQLPAKTK